MTQHDPHVATRKHYGLRTVARDLLPRVMDELERFKVWRAIGVNPYRDVPVDPVEEETVVGSDWPRILGFMGFLCTHVLDGEQPSLTMHANKDWFLRFMSFLVERGCSQAYVRSHITVATYVLNFLGHTIATPEEGPRVAALIAELQRVHRQVLWVAAPPKPRDKTALEQANSWMDYDELLKCSLDLMKQGKAAMREVFGDLEDEDAQAQGATAVMKSVYMPEDNARVVHDAALGNIVCGWLPTIRPKMLRSLKAPNYRNAPCTQ
ncbi:hypothetical protein COHA_005453 [Chlorella ohadii]|uniref:Uncharacterized protein n=1 Tax=Chlorella ohadii TaxID=2649997 RepID=A0AAD5DNE7_9CHLO|nr:hypothetical protein COHA_005453 [Chlorella ohadii]